MKVPASNIFINGAFSFLFFFGQLGNSKGSELRAALNKPLMDYKSFFLPFMLQDITNDARV